MESGPAYFLAIEKGSCSFHTNLLLHPGRNSESDLFFPGAAAIMEAKTKDKGAFGNADPGK